MNPVPEGYFVLRELKIRENDYSIESIRMDDAEKIRQWRNQQISVLRQKKILTKAEQQSYFTQVILSEFPKIDPNPILVRFLLGNEMIGYGGIVHLDWLSKQGEVSFLLETNRSKISDRYAFELGVFFHLIKQLAFGHLKLNKLTTEAYAHRPHHVDAIENSGFTRVEILKNRARVKGKWVDGICAQCDNSSFQSSQK